MTTQPSEQKIVNGVNVTALFDTIEAVKGNPDIADFKFRAKNEWQNGSHNKIQIDGFYGTGQEIEHPKPFNFEADEPSVLLGTDQAASPVEYLLTALSACMTTTLAYHAAAQGIEIESINSEYEGDLDLKGFLGVDPKVRKGFKEIRVNFKVKSDADREKLLQLVKKSPVYDIVTNPTPVKVVVEKE